MMVTHTRPSMKPRITGTGMKAATQPMRSAPNSRKKVDPLATFNAHMIANGGKDLVMADGKLHADDPQVREAVIKTLTRFAKLIQDGYAPLGAVNWNDQDNNNSFHAKEIVLCC
jgi:ABC-type glycerol-3-phosphate transport system substrate-binding protein